MCGRHTHTPTHSHGFASAQRVRSGKFAETHTRPSCLHMTAGYPHTNARALNVIRPGWFKSQRATHTQQAVPISLRGAARVLLLAGGGTHAQRCCALNMLYKYVRQAFSGTPLSFGNGFRFHARTFRYVLGVNTSAEKLTH